MAEKAPTPPPPRKKPRQKEKKGALGIWVGIALVVLLAMYVAVLDNARPRVAGDALSFSTFVDMAENNQIKDATILDFDDYIVGRYQKSDKTTGDYNVAYLRGIGSDRQALLVLLLQDRVSVSIDQQGLKGVISLGGYILPPLIVAVLFVYLIVSYRRGTGLFGIRSGARKATADLQTTRFSDVAGQDAAITELQEVVEYLRDPTMFAAVGARIPKGILMYGPPGCGKTLLAKALAGEAGASFYSISGSDFVEVYVGVGAARVRDLFKQAEETSPALIFIDEIDAVGRTRGAGDAPQTGAGEQEQSLNAILTAMDGFTTSDGIIVIAATNRPDVLDPALLRPGRFDRSVALERPDEHGRVAILAVHARSRPLAGDVDLAVVANRAVG
ncbi:MAG TPA: ATP-dependent metallopeptidase FtsH/Yme1/Tma family protein, partial [Candidatus Dormibacteraeota bacterium]|nr:ATP-dependent metallopeptidase FtsH/Yme1/Tma family protein [Candidatus Dormibacteraeota bacterium]